MDKARRSVTLAPGEALGRNRVSNMMSLTLFALALALVLVACVKVRKAK